MYNSSIQHTSHPGLRISVARPHRLAFLHLVSLNFLLARYYRSLIETNGWTFESNSLCAYVCTTNSKQGEIVSLPNVQCLLLDRIYASPGAHTWCV